MAAESRPGPAAHRPGAAEERADAPAPDGGVGVARGAAAHHGQHQRQGLPHHGGTAVCPEHLPGHGLHLRHRPAQGTESQLGGQKCSNLRLILPVRRV